MCRLRVFLLPACIVLGCAFPESNPFAMWPDDETSAIFMDQEPSCEEVQMWYEVHTAVTEIWGREPESMYVWFVRSQDQTVYYNGQVQTWPEGVGGMTTWGVGLPDLYVGVFHDPWVARNIMCHEMTHVYWRLSDHDSEEFKARQRELLEAVWAADAS